MSKAIVASVAAITAAVLASDPAQATGVMRAWVSGHGTDAAGGGAPSNPCRSLQYVHDNIIAAGGEIDILDPAGYGAVSINKAISIVNDGVGTAGVQQTSAGHDAVSIGVQATNSVTLRGLTLDGLGLAQDGIGLTGAGKVTIVNCVIRHFTHDGIYMQPSASSVLAVINTIASDNGNDGFDLSPVSGGALLADIEGSFAINNHSDGVVVWGANGASYLQVVVANSDLSLNGGYGVLSNGPTAILPQLTIRGAVADNNGAYGYEADGGTFVISHSEAEFDGINVGSGAQGFSYGDNAIPGDNVHGTLTVLSQH